MQNAHESAFKASKHALIPDSDSAVASNSARLRPELQVSIQACRATW